jgi:hypothetical protein
MPELALTEWLTSKETRVLRAYLRQRQAAPLRQFLTGQAVEPLDQGRAAAFNEIDGLLARPADEVQKIFETALKEQKT